MPRKRPPPHKCEHQNCKAYARIGQRFCRRHEHHQAQVGTNAPNYRHGRYSTSLPEQLKDRYQASRQDRLLLELEDEIAVCIARNCALQEKLQTYESGKAWREVKKAIATLDERIHSKDVKGVLESLETLQELSEQGCGEYAVWDELNKNLKLHASLVESQRRRQLELKMYLNVERAMTLVDALVDAVSSEVDEVSKREAIIRKLNSVLNLTHNSNQAQRERSERLEQFYQSEAENSGLW